MIRIDLLKKHPQAIPVIANIWYEVLGKIWLPEISIQEIESLTYQEISQDMPLTFIALSGDVAVGFCTLELDGGIRPDLEPWIGDLVVDLKYQQQGIGKMLLDAAIDQAKKLNYRSLYLFAFDPNIVKYYNYLGWRKIGMDKFKSHMVTVMTIKL